ncbi:protein of unknown function [Rhodovastum atsumiense]|nr:protein of unknown function [Rhodovastum atsumiense]
MSAEVLRDVHGKVAAGKTVDLSKHMPATAQTQMFAAAD